MERDAHLSLPAPEVAIRRAAPADNEALLRLAAACPMRGAVTVCVHREPDFFALSRLQGAPWEVLVAVHPAAGIVGCIGVAGREVWLNGAPARTMYVSDLKVDERFRGCGIGDALVTAARCRCGVEGDDVPVWSATLAGNRAIERREAGPRGTPRLTPAGTVRVHVLFPLGIHRRRPGGPYMVRPAQAGDLEAMAALWRRVAPWRQAAPVLDAGALARWIARAPGLAIDDYLVAFRDGEPAAFLGAWDQRALKETRVLGYGLGTHATRLAYNALAPLLGAPRLPAAGGALASLHAVHVCVPGEEPAALRALLVAAGRRCAERRVPILEIGLDPRDPLARAVRGWAGVRTDVRCYVSAPRGAYRGPALDARPLHFETAMV